MQEESSEWGSWDTVEEAMIHHLMIRDIERQKDAFRSLGYSEKVDCTYDTLKNVSLYMKTISVPPVPKSNESSIKYRICGNEYFNTKKYYDAFEMYTKSITFAENGSKSLALAYGNRSAVLYIRKYYRECLKDIERALTYDIPDKTRIKLMIRKTKAEELKGNQNPIIYYNPAPVITKINPIIPIASASVKIQHNKKYGRHIVATENIKAGDVISVEDSFVHEIHKESKYVHCHHCLELSYNPIPCNKCTIALYCGEDCLHKAKSGYHKYECDFPANFKFPGILSIRMTLKGLDELKNEAAVETDGIYRSDSFKAVLALETNEDKTDVFHQVRTAVIACTAYHCLRSNPEFNLKYNVDPKIIKEYLYRTCMIETFNTASIQKIRYDFNDVYFKDVGTAIYGFTSLFNHSCVPNCDIFHHGTLTVVRASATIPKGEQCYLRYGMCFSTTEYRQRHQLLKKRHLLDCDCRACMNRWPVFSELPVGKGLPLSFQVKSSRRIFFKKDGNKKLLDELVVEALHLLKDMEKFEPCQNYLVLQKIIEEIYAYEGCTDLKF